MAWASSCCGLFESCTSNNQWDIKPARGPGMLPPKGWPRRENAVGFFIKLIREGEKKNAELFGGFKKAFQLKKSNQW